MIMPQPFLLLSLNQFAPQLSTQMQTAGLHLDTSKPQFHDPGSVQTTHTQTQAGVRGHAGCQSLAGDPILESENGHVPWTLTSAADGAVTYGRQGENSQECLGLERRLRGSECWLLF